MTPIPDPPRRGARAVPHETRLLSLIAANIRDMVVFVDLEGRIQWVNEAVVEQFGYTRDELIGAHVYTLQAREKNAPGIWAPGRTGELLEKWAGVIVDRRRDGSEFSARVESFLVRDEHGSVTGIASISRDISEMVRAEEALRSSEQIIEGIINAIPVRVFWKDKNLAYLGCNAAFARDAGFADPKDIIGKDDHQMGWHDQAELYRGDDRQVIESGCSKLLIEEPQTTPEGNTISLLTSKIPLRSPKGEIVGVLGTYMDITERKRAERALRESEERYRVLFEGSRDALMTLEPPSWVFTACNQSTVNMFKAKSEEEFVSYRPWELSPERQPDGRASVEKAGEMIEKAMREGSHFFEWTHTRISGEEFPATVLLTKVEYTGRQFLQATARDMTELKDYQRTLEERNRELEIISSAALTREFRIKELRDEIRDLKKRLAGLSERAGGEG